MDAFDTVFLSGDADIGCEHAPAARVSGCEDIGWGGGGGRPRPGPHPTTPAAKLILGPVLSPHREKLLVAARVNGPGVVTGKATKGKKLLAKGSVTATHAGAVTLVIKPTKAGKRLLKEQATRSRSSSSWPSSRPRARPL